MNIRIDLNTSGITGDVRGLLAADCEAAKAKLWSGEEDFTGWVSLPEKLTCDPESTDACCSCAGASGSDDCRQQINELQAELVELKKTAEEIKDKCDLLVVIGIGGSYMGARCVIDAIAAHQELAGPEVIFAGCNMSAAYHRDIIKKMREKETCLCVISKSGGTTEPLAAFSILKEEMTAKYGDEAASRIYAITDKAKGRLREEADEAGYKTFIVPDDIGGRYSVLTPVGLLPIAVSGIDIDKLIAGAADMAKDPGWRVDAATPVTASAEDAVSGSDGADAQAVNAAAYAMTRVALSRSGKWIEIFEYFHPELDFFAEWLKQLFGESEGKEGKGIFPASLMFSRDLHSMGQFIQQGKQMFFETMIIIDDRGEDIMIPGSAGAPLAGKSLEQINDCAIRGVAAAHTKAGVPVIKIYLPKMDAYNMGQLIYFFEMTCGIAAYISGVNPFDQPGVEAYKAEMRAEIEKL